jgi:hypothetical protein
MTDMTDETTGAAQCRICGEWRDDPATACSCGLARDKYGWSHVMARQLYVMAVETNLTYYPTPALKALAQNLTRMADLATEAAARAVSELNERGAL